MITNRKAKSLERKIALEHARGDKFKAMAAKAEHELVLMRRKLDANFCRGSAVTMAAVYQAVGNDQIALWLSDRLLHQRIRKPPFGLSAEVEAAARRDAIEELRKCGLKNLDPENDIDEVIRSIAL